MPSALLRVDYGFEAKQNKDYKVKPFALFHLEVIVPLGPLKVTWKQNYYVFRFVNPQSPSNLTPKPNKFGSYLMLLPLFRLGTPSTLNKLRGNHNFVVIFLVQKCFWVP